MRENLWEQKPNSDSWRVKTSQTEQRDSEGEGEREREREREEREIYKFVLFLILYLVGVEWLLETNLFVVLYF